MSEPITIERSLSAKQQTNDDELLEGKRKKLFKLAMRDKWEEVIAIYKAHPEVQGERLTRAKATTLHVAISSGKEDVALRLLAAVQAGKEEQILKAKTDTQSTPLHLAASHGMARACRAMAKRCPRLVRTERNRHGETPLFTAVRHGKKEAFFAFELMVQEQGRQEKRDKGIAHCRRHKDGNNILHYAILGEYFEMANEIIGLYPNLVHYRNTRGESPLHYLANKPLCFKSGTRFSLYDQLIYSCIIVSPLKRNFDLSKHQSSSESQNLTSGDPRFPETFDTFYHVYTLLKPFLQMVARIPNWIHIPEWIRRICPKCDEENQAAKLPKNNSTTTPSKDDQESSQGRERNKKFPEIYDVDFAFFKVVIKFIVVVLGIGLWRVKELEKKKRQNKYACQLMDELVEGCKDWEYTDGMDPNIERSKSGPAKPPDAPPQTDEHSQQHEDSLEGESKAEDGRQVNVNINIYKDEQKRDESKEPHIASPVLVAAKNGITEMVKKILDIFPVAVLDVDDNEKNIVLVAVEYRQSHIYEFMLSQKIMKDSAFGKIDKEGNTVLHLAAMHSQKLPWSIPGVALQMQWEIKWYKYVKRSMESEIFHAYNNNGKTAKELFIETHEGLVKDAGEWLVKTSESCSVVAALIAGVAFASAATVPGGLNQNSGQPILSDQTTFQVFAFSSLVALCFSVTSLIMFLTILTSRYQEEDFNKSLPTKLLVGLTTLFTSIAAMIVSFCAGDFFVVQKKLKFAAFPLYAVMLLPVSFFAIAQFPLYIDLIWATLAKLPDRAQKMRTF